MSDVRAVLVIIQATEDRFWSKVKKSARCWEWQAGRDSFGYGKFSVNRNPIRAHRVSMMLHLGQELPPGECVLHTCDNPACVNPTHLYIGDRKQNGRDMKKRGRAPRSTGESNGNAVLTEAVVRAVRCEYVPRKVTRVMLAEKYGININTIDNIIYRKSYWKGVA